MGITTSGRATSRKSPRATPVSPLASRLEGVPRRPSTRNMQTWRNQAPASCAWSTPPLKGSGPLPMSTAATYTERKPLPVEELGDPEGEQRDGGGEHGVEPAHRQPHPGEDPAPGPADGEPGHEPHRELEHHLDGGAPPQGTTGDELGGEGLGEDHRHRVVEPRLELQGGPHPALQLDAARPEDGEDRRRVGGGDDGPEEQGLLPGEVRAAGRRPPPARPWPARPPWPAPRPAPGPPGTTPRAC